MGREAKTIWPSLRNEAICWAPGLVALVPKQPPQTSHLPTGDHLLDGPHSGKQWTVVDQFRLSPVAVEDAEKFRIQF